MKGKLCVLSLSFISYFNLISNLSIILISSLTFQCYVNLVFAVISWMEITNVVNSQNKKLVFVNLIFILTVCHINNFHLRDYGTD